jgi:hypothetical protein
MQTIFGDLWKKGLSYKTALLMSVHLFICTWVLDWVNLQFQTEKNAYHLHVMDFCFFVPQT